MDWKTRIVVESAVLVGKPVIKGTRLSVEFLLDLFAQGWHEQQVLDNYPRLTAEDLQAVLHLLHDDREITGGGESEFVRGACWVGPIANVNGGCN